MGDPPRPVGWRERRETGATTETVGVVKPTKAGDKCSLPDVTTKVPGSRGGGSLKGGQCGERRLGRMS